MNDNTGVMAVDQLVIWSVAAVAIAGLLGLLWRLTRGVRRIARLLDEFVDDWRGTPGRPGVPGHQGVMARLGGIEQRLIGVEHELHPNSGGSLRDAVDRVEQCVTGPSAPAE